MENTLVIGLRDILNGLRIQEKKAKEKYEGIRIQRHSLETTISTLTSRDDANDE